MNSKDIWQEGILLWYCPVQGIGLAHGSDNIALFVHKSCLPKKHQNTDFQSDEDNKIAINFTVYENSTTIQVDKLIFKEVS